MLSRTRAGRNGYSPYLGGLTVRWKADGHRFTNRHRPEIAGKAMLFLAGDFGVNLPRLQLSDIEADGRKLYSLFRPHEMPVFDFDL